MVWLPRLDPPIASGNESRRESDAPFIVETERPRNRRVANLCGRIDTIRKDVVSAPQARSGFVTPKEARLQVMTQMSSNARSGRLAFGVRPKTRKARASVSEGLDSLDGRRARAGKRAVTNIRRSRGRFIVRRLKNRRGDDEDAIRASDQRRRRGQAVSPSLAFAQAAAHLWRQCDDVGKNAAGALQDLMLSYYLD